MELGVQHPGAGERDALTDEEWGRGPAKNTD
jgi:hypothetical protein